MVTILVTQIIKLVPHHYQARVFQVRQRERNEPLIQAGRHRRKNQDMWLLRCVAVSTPR